MIKFLTELFMSRCGVAVPRWWENNDGLPGYLETTPWMGASCSMFHHINFHIFPIFGSSIM